MFKKQNKNKNILKQNSTGVWPDLSGIGIIPLSCSFSEPQCSVEGATLYAVCFNYGAHLSLCLLKATACSENFVFSTFYKFIFAKTRVLYLHAVTSMLVNHSAKCDIYALKKKCPTAH